MSLIPLGSLIPLLLLIILTVAVIILAVMIIIALMPLLVFPPALTSRTVLVLEKGQVDLLAISTGTDVAPSLVFSITKAEMPI